MKGLSFRKTGLSKKTRRHIILMLILFLASLAFFEVVLNFQPKTEVKTLQAGGSLPILCVETMGTKQSTMHGYLTKMDGCYMRESLTPLGKNRDMSLLIDDYGSKITDLSYEIRSMDTERKIAEEPINNLKESGNNKTAKLVLSNLLEEGEEYLLVISMKADGREVYYYTRIMQPSNEHLRDCLKFAKHFHDTAIQGDASDLEQYLETDPHADSQTLSLVTLRSTLSQISWRGFEGKVDGDIDIRFSEIGNDYASIIYDYQRLDEKGNRYVISEYFKMRYTASRMYLLDYERTMEEIPGKSFSLNENVMKIGIVADDFRYISNDTGTVTAFVQAGELFEYNKNTGRIVKVFGFRKEKGRDVHADYEQHGIRLLGIDENGALDFVVYGYMNEGDREGCNGMSLFHYDVGEDVVSEQAFIAVTRPYPVLDASFSDLLYKNANGKLYIMMDGTLTQIDGDTAYTKEIMTGLRNEQYAVSNSGRYLAWIKEETASSRINIMDLETEKSSTLESKNNNEWLRPLAFLEDNFVYGIVRKTDVGSDAAGNRIYPCCKVLITDIKGKSNKILKEYEKPGYYVSEVTTNSYTLFMSRVTKQGEEYERTNDDTIQDSSGEPNKAVSLQKTPQEEKGIVTSIVLSKSRDDKDESKVKVTDSAIAYADATAFATLEVSDVHENYYVYVGNRVLLASTNVTEAIKKADREMGIVVDNEQHNIWKRTRSAYVNPFTGLAVGFSDGNAKMEARAISAMLVREGENVEVHSLLEAGQSPVEILAGALKKATILDLSGCELDQVLYFISCGSPVYVHLSGNDTRLVTGYDAANVYVYNPANGETKKFGLEDAAATFKESGNVYISYIK